MIDTNTFNSGGIDLLQFSVGLAFLKAECCQLCFS
jgi:hypothetical protein